LIDWLIFKPIELGLVGYNEKTINIPVISD